MNEWLSTLDIRLVKVARSTLDLSWNGRDPNPAYVRIYLMESGRGHVRVGNENHALMPGKLYAFPSGLPMAHRAASPIRILWLHGTFSILSGLDAFRFFACPRACPLQHPLQVKRMFVNLLACWNNSSLSSQAEAQGIARLLFAFFLKDAGPATAPQSHTRMLRFRPVLSFIDGNLHRPVRVTELARVACLAPNYFTRSFKCAWGVTPARYLNLRKIDRAKRMLLESDRSIKAVADALGFSDAFHFSKVFRQLAGMPPKTFRKQLPAQVP